MRLIDADALKEWIDEYVSVFKKSEVEYDTRDTMFLNFIQMLQLADGVELVKCEDCKHWYSDADCGMACEFTNMSQPNDGYCNWGVPKQTERESE